MEKKPKKYLEDVLSKEDCRNFTRAVESLYFSVEENYPFEDIRMWADHVCSFARKLKEAVT